ncbi:MAG TPA: DnaJ domain-containing protein [Acidobacteriota bacterium]|nr:DnaJ domain-containing protein [Acidobacteriota bacterium]
MAKNYYSILGVLPTATFDEIKSAYRSRVKQYHPDRFGKDTVPFLRIQEAYDVLGDPANRSYYDHSLEHTSVGPIPISRSEPVTTRPRKAPVEPVQSQGEIIDLGTISSPSLFRSYQPALDEILDGLWSAFDRTRETKFDKFRTLTMEVRLTPDQARCGGRLRIQLPIPHACDTCKGLGEVGPFYCRRCSGTGICRSGLPLEVEYPPGIADRCEIAIPLNRYGISDVCPILVFRVSHAGDFEGL